MVQRRNLSIPSAKRTYGLIATAMVLLLVGGLLFPLVFGDPEARVLAGGSQSISTLPALTDSGPAAATPGAESASNEAGPTATTAVRGSAGPAAGGPEGSLTASDVGVTASTIKVGVVLLDLGPVGPLGLGLENFEVETQRKMFQAYIDDTNRRGGINGRTIEPAYVVNDPLATTNAGDARAQCLQLTNDLKVFAVIGFITDATSCVVRERRTPTVKYTADLQEAYTQSGYYLSDPVPSLERTAADWAGAMEDLGNLRGKTIGIVAGEVPVEDRPARALQTTIEKLGYKVAHRTKLSSDEAAAQSQLPLEVQRMQSAGVDLVFFPTNFATAIMWVQAAEGQGWTPRYTTSDIGALASAGLVRNMPRSFEGAIGITNFYGGVNDAGVRAPERAQETSCRELYNNSTDGEDFAWGEESPMYQICGMTRTFERGATGGGAKLTRDGFVSAIQGLGQFPWPNYIGGSFARGKTDYSDFVQPERWVTSCKCYRVTGAPLRVRY